MATEHMERCSTLLLGKCKSKSQQDKTSHYQDGYLKKTVTQKISVGKDAEELEPLSIVGGNINWCSRYGNQYGSFSD